VKVLDGTAFNGKYWVFFGSLTGETYQVEVVDSTGAGDVFHGALLVSLLAGGTYYVGRLPPVMWLQWTLSRSPLLLAAAVVALAFIGAVAAYLSLQLRARRRLR